ncbi:SMP-30/gluconolactonase/LRE family protein [Pedobacter boryungensis]|uniref:SMP-30/gluconolactonase/LRE family protein n=1 Tax=Pedobacter boryungensis TaxID=869962 RepID=A0ABX2DAB7_9SPHI|nr:SMP-30/gluconolactonase/LRE family protein [Pedobacter boryungensis]NQX31008.1 SMP-30/gluconolactonase/LRE family protein [Pedobacter boryungensis]
MERIKFYSLIKIFLVCFLFSFAVSAQTNKPLFKDSLKLISSQFKFTEGASVDKKGNVFFSDQPSNTIWKYSVDGNLSLFTDKSGRANGTYFDKKGNLLACADENFQILSFDRNGISKSIYKNPKENDLNGPNDLWIDKKGGIYFTDPYYQRNYWTRKTPAIVGEKVYYIPNKEESPIKIVEEGLEKPNGIVGTPDGKLLYVADAKAGKIYQYSIQPNGTLTNKVLLINQGSDGMTLDEKGNIYLTGNGVTIFNKEGVQIEHINVSKTRTSNLCFAGKNRNILFITAGSSIYILPMLVKGVE